MEKQRIVAFLIGIAFLQLALGCGVGGDENCRGGEVFNRYWDGCRPPGRVQDRCADDEDCQMGLICFEAVQRVGFGSGSSVVSSCQRPQGNLDEPCGTFQAGTLSICVAGTTCNYQEFVTVGEQPARLGSSEQAEVGAGAGNGFWGDTGERFSYESVTDAYCRENGPLAQGQQCSLDEHCRDGLVCNFAYQPERQCQPLSGSSRPCLRDEECAGGVCIAREPSLEKPGSLSCALPAEACDPRVNDACDYWLSCEKFCANAP